MDQVLGCARSRVAQAAALLLTVVLGAAALLLACPPAAHAALSVRMEAGLAKPETNVGYMGTVAWAGKLWYVVGTSSEGVKANNAEGTVTLLAKDSFTEMAYREGDASSFAGASFDAASRWYYAGTWTNGPADYLGSSVQTYLSTWLDDNLVSALEQGLAVERPISDVGRTQGIPQKLWLLSQDEQFRRVQESTDQLDPGLIPLGYAGLDALDQSWWTRTGNGADKLHGYAKAIVADPYGPVDSSDYVHNKQAVRPAAVRPDDPVRDGYEFNGWATQSGTSFDFDRDTVLGDTQLTAIWAPLPYTVVYDANDAASVDPLACTWDTTHLNAPSPTRENYVFDGWWCGKLVAADTKAGDLARSAGEADRAVTLTAKWVNKKGYSINYDAAGGTAVAGKTDLAYDQAGLLPATVPVRDAKDSRKFVEGARVCVTSLAQGKEGNYTQAVTNKLGVAVLKVDDLAEDPANEKYDFYGTVLVAKEGCRDFETGAMRITTAEFIDVWSKEPRQYRPRVSVVDIDETLGFINPRIPSRFNNKVLFDKNRWDVDFTVRGLADIWPNSNFHWAAAVVYTT